MKQKVVPQLVSLAVQRRKWKLSFFIPTVISQFDRLECALSTDDALCPAQAAEFDAVTSSSSSAAKGSHVITTGQAAVVNMLLLSVVLLLAAPSRFCVGEWRRRDVSAVAGGGGRDGLQLSRLNRGGEEVDGLCDERRLFLAHRDRWIKAVSRD